MQIRPLTSSTGVMDSRNSTFRDWTNSSVHYKECVAVFRELSFSCVQIPSGVANTKGQK